jgi:hypothetical protein
VDGGGGNLSGPAALELGCVVGERLGVQAACVDVALPAEAAKEDGIVPALIPLEVAGGRRRHPLTPQRHRPASLSHLPMSCTWRYVFRSDLC